MNHNQSKKPSQDVLYNQYIKQNMTILELTSFYSVSDVTISKWLKSYNITKPKALSVKRGQETNLKRYGGIAPLQNKEIQAKSRETMMKKYGVEYASQAPEIREKIEAVNLERYGTTTPLSSDEIKEKIKQTNLEKYGVENPMQNKDIQEKKYATNLERYGDAFAQRSEHAKEQQKKTNLEKYGVENVMQLQEFKDKAKTTNLEKYGTDNPMQNKDVQERAAETNLERYGAKSYLHSKKGKEIIKEIIKERYGVNNVLQSEEIKAKIKETNLEKYGVEHPSQSQEIREKIYQTNISKYGVSNPFASEDIRQKIKQTVQEKYGVDYFCLRPECFEHTNGSDSKPNLTFAALLEATNFDFTREYRINNYRFDFKSENFLFEIDPTATHNVNINPYGEPISKEYHYNKSHIANQQGLHCVHIFGWEDPEKVVFVFSKKPKIYARQCEVREVPETDTHQFLNTYHIQGTCKHQSIRLGLYYKDELVELMTFGKPRYNKKYEYELLRLVSGKYSVIGGAKKLYSHFLKMYDPKSIISYCDNSKFTGKVYEDLGMKLQTYGTPTCHWIRFDDTEHITDNLLRQRGFDQLFGKKYGASGKGSSNEELMIKNGWVQVYDCGQSVFVWNKAL